MDEVKKYLDEAEESMEMAAMHLEEALSRIRAGKANVHILDGIKVDSYGTMVPLSGVASLTTPDARSIAIKPWDKNMFKVIEKAIINSNVGIMPENNGISLFLPRSVVANLPSSVRGRLSRQRYRFATHVATP